MKTVGYNGLRDVFVEVSIFPLINYPVLWTRAEGAPGKSGTSRRMVGSPRMLETAVPTSKNPHGVWV